MLKTKPDLSVNNEIPAKLLRYDLMMELSKQGFTMRCIFRRRDVGQIKNEPYVHGESKKEWFVQGRHLSLESVHPFYLLALVRAAGLQAPIPHLAPENVYRKLLDETFEPPPPKRRKHGFVAVAENDFEFTGAKPKQGKAKLKAAKPQSKGGLVALLLDDDGVNDNAELSDPLDADLRHADVFAQQTVEGSDSPDESSSSSSASSTSSSSASSSSSSSSSSKPGGSNDKEATKKPSEIAESSKPEIRVPAKAGSKRAARDTEFGDCFLTPRYVKGTLGGYQMTCTRDAHKGERRCTKEVSISVAGGEDLALRMLKAWIVFGSSVPDRDTHRTQVWTLIKDMAKEGGLPSQDELDRNAPQDWSIINADMVVGDFQLPETSMVSSPSRLGEALPGVPEAVHARMEAMALAGSLPITTPQQRKRAKFTGGSSLLWASLLHGEAVCQKLYCLLVTLHYSVTYQLCAPTSAFWPELSLLICKTPHEP